MKYPETPDQLADYLEYHPALEVELPKGKKNTYIYTGFDDLRMTFKTKSGESLMFSIVTLKSLIFTENGFIRRINDLIGYFFYTGPKPWVDYSSNREWDEVFNGMSYFWRL